ncbi:hypothetical protein [Streptomyces rubiginosohelvolus]|uniref:hypothetical protein n=1 Tax=Streptomyces rubiginosohelvolus TaxID=67362 RepID=UPI0033B7F467
MAALAGDRPAAVCPARLLGAAAAARRRVTAAARAVLGAPAFTEAFDLGDRGGREGVEDVVREARALLGLPVPTAARRAAP